MFQNTCCSHVHSYSQVGSQDEIAHGYLVREVKEVHRNATQKQIYAKAFKDECPHCHKPQSWAISGAKDDMFSTPIVCVILGIIIGAGCYFFSGVENNRIPFDNRDILLNHGGSLLLFISNLDHINDQASCRQDQADSRNGLHQHDGGVHLICAGLIGPADRPPVGHYGSDLSGGAPGVGQC